LENLAISVLAGGGVTAIILGFAFREIGENFLAGMFLAFSRPFKVDDAIKSEDIEGTVKNIELRYTHLRTGDGRDIYVPSAQLFNKPLTNFTKDGLRRISFTIGLDYSNDAKDACALLQKTMEKATGVLEDPRPRAYISSLLPEYVEIELFFWVDVFDGSVDILSLRTDIMDGCRRALLEGDYVLSADTTANIAITNISKDQ
jgi:small-conductance mechanosensitive channel